MLAAACEGRLWWLLLLMSCPGFFFGGWFLLPLGSLLSFSSLAGLPFDPAREEEEREEEEEEEEEEEAADNRVAGSLTMSYSVSFSMPMT